MAIAVNCGRSGADTAARISAAIISEEIELSRLAEDDVNLPAEPSGERIKVMLNAGLSQHEKLGSRIDGIGLYRTEIPFMLAKWFPVGRRTGGAVSGDAANVQ